MLSYRPLKNNAGILLCGDYLTLKALHEVVHVVNEKSPLIHNKEGVFLSFAYDIRKAYEGQRQVLQPAPHAPEIGIRYGVEMLWPMLLMQSRMLRASLAYFDSDKQQQSLAYALELVIETAIAQELKSQADIITYRWSRIDPAIPWPEQKINGRSALFCSWSKAERLKKLPDLLASLDPMYTLFYEHAMKNGKPNLLSPAELDEWDGMDWPDPKW